MTAPTTIAAAAASMPTREKVDEPDSCRTIDSLPSSFVKASGRRQVDGAAHH
jgi:hypothetical protein